MKPSDGSGAIPALALAHRSNAVSGHTKSTISIATHQITTGTCSQMVLGHRRARKPPSTPYPTKTKCAVTVTATRIRKKSAITNTYDSYLDRPLHDTAVRRAGPPAANRRPIRRILER